MSTYNLIGKITLEEKINIINSSVHTHSLILDVPNPLASYYSNFAGIQKPNSIILVTKERISYESILRATKKINNDVGGNLSGAKCETQIDGNLINGIRLKGIENYTDIDLVISMYEKEGFDFTTNMKLNNQKVALIRVNKFFELVKIDNLVYQSTQNKDEYYFRMNQPIQWEDFKIKIKHLKNNVNVNGFDIAQAILYKKGRIDDIVRVIKPNLTLSEVHEIHKKYNS